MTKEQVEKVKPGDYYMVRESAHHHGGKGTFLVNVITTAGGAIWFDRSYPHIYYGGNDWDSVELLTPVAGDGGVLISAKTWQTARLEARCAVAGAIYHARNLTWEAAVKEAEQTMGLLADMGWRPPEECGK